MKVRNSEHFILKVCKTCVKAHVSALLISLILNSRCISAHQQFLCHMLASFSVFSFLIFLCFLSLDLLSSGLYSLSPLLCSHRSFNLLGSNWFLCYHPTQPVLKLPVTSREESPYATFHLHPTSALVGSYTHVSCQFFF